MGGCPAKETRHKKNRHLTEESMYLMRVFSRVLLAVTVAALAVFLFTHRNVVDSRGPVIHIEEPLIEVSVEDGEERLLEGVTASDSSDGDVTDSVEVENISTFYADGKRLVTYVAFDSDMHVGRETREIRYTDYEAPRFRLEEPLQYYTGSVNLKISAEDCIDGDISSAIKLVTADPITTDQPGEYKATFQVANSAGDVSSLPVTIEILDDADRSSVRINLDTCLLYIGKDDDFDPADHITSVQIGSKEYRVVEGSGNYGAEEIDPDAEIVVGTDQISMSGSVDTETPGTYQVKYSLSIDKGHSDVDTGHTVLYVVVR